MNDNQSWLADLKTDDKVAVQGRIRDCIDTVLKVTNTQIVLKNGDRFNRTTGYSIGSGSWNSAQITPVTDEIRIEVLLRKYKSQALSMLSKIEIPSDIDGIKALLAAIEPFIKS